MLTLSGLLVGWRIHTDIPHAVAGFALLVLFAAAMVSLGTLAGIVARSPDGVTGLVFITAFPLTFLANTFVPADGLPAALRTVAEWNPISALVAAVRTLFGNPTALGSHTAWPIEHAVLESLIWCVLILAVTVPLCLRRFEARTRN